MRSSWPESWRAGLGWGCFRACRELSDQLMVASRRTAATWSQKTDGDRPTLKSYISGFCHGAKTSGLSSRASRAA